MNKFGRHWISWLEVGLLAAMAPLFVFPASDRLWAFLVFPILWIARFWIEKNRRDSSVGTPIDLAILLLTVQLFVSSTVSGDWEMMLPKIAGIVYGILVFYALVRVLRTERLAGVAVGGFITGGTALVAFGLTGMFISKEPHFRKIVGPLFDKIPQKNWEFAGAEAGLNPNAVAGVMLLFVPLCLCLAGCWIKARWRDSAGMETNPAKAKTNPSERLVRTAGISAPVICGALSMIFLIVLFMTQAVAAWLALAASLWLVLPTGKSRMIGIVPVALFMASVLIFLPEADTEAAAARDTMYWKKKIEDRHLRWIAGIDAVRKKPLTGVGVNMLRQRPELGGYERSHAHNQMLHTAAEMGIPGLIAYLAILGGGLWMCRSVWRRAGPGWMRAVARGLGAGQAAHFIFGWGDSIPLGAKPGIFFWVSLALIAALYNISKRTQAEVSEPVQKSRRESSDPATSESAQADKSTPLSTHFYSGFIKQPLFLKRVTANISPAFLRDLKVAAVEKSGHRILKHGHRHFDDREKSVQSYTSPREKNRVRFVVTVTVLIILFFTLFPPTASAQSSFQRRVLATRAQTAVASESPGQTENVRAERMIRGNPAAIWRSRKGDAPPFVFVFALATDSRIELLRFYNSGREDKRPGVGAREVEVEFSTTSPKSGYYRAGFFSLEKGNAPQEFRIPRSRARWVRLTIHSNHGHPHFTELGEFEAWGQFDFHAGMLASYFIWIMGAALVLGAFGWHENAARREKRRLRDVIRRPSFLEPAALGTVLIGAGIAASARGPGLAVLGAAISIAAAAWLIRSVLARPAQ